MAVKERLVISLYILGMLAAYALGSLNN